MIVDISVTTNGSGAGNDTGEPLQGPHKLYAIDYIPGTIATGATITISDEGTESITVFSKANAGTANTRIYPRALEALASDGSNLSTHSAPVMHRVPKFTVASGGAAKAGSVRLFFEKVNE